MKSLLRPGPESEAFAAQPTADQRHGLTAAETVAVAQPDRRDLQRAALLHDIGKRHSRLGAFGRVWATLRLPAPGRWGRRTRLYRDHGPIGATELESWGAEQIVVDYARHHHHARPDHIADSDWDLLERADRIRSRRRARTVTR